MRTSYKILLCTVLFLFAAAISCFRVYPAFVEVEQKSADVKQRVDENRDLLKKLQDKKKTQEERNKLETQIQALRGSVPKSPELDLLVLDLEKLCHDCNLDLVGVENPDTEMLSQIKASEGEMQKLSNENAGKLSIGSKSLAKNEAASAKAEATVQATLKELPKQVFVTGTYENFIKLLHKLENYQRIIGVSNVSVALPVQISGTRAAAAEKANRLKVNQTMMSFLMTVYYLP